LSTNPLDVAWAAFQAVINLDKRNRYEKELKTQFRNLLVDFMNQGEANFRGNKPAEALEDFKRVLEIHKGRHGSHKVDTVVIYNAGVAAQQAGLWDDAVKYYKQAIDLNYNPLRTYAMISKILLDQGRGEEDPEKRKVKEQEGLAFLQEGYERFPEDQYLLIELINYYLYTNDFNSALSYIERAIELDPGHAEYYRGAGIVHEQLGDSTSAESRYAKALELNPKDFVSWYNLGNIRLNRAIKAHEALIAQNDLIAYNARIGEVMMQYEAVIPFFEKALELKPDDRVTLTTLGQLYFRLRGKPNSDYLKKYERVQRLLGN
jgi:tetratricopeptide (TPR) repeat protein